MQHKCVQSSGLYDNSKYKHGSHAFSREHPEGYIQTEAWNIEKKNCPCVAYPLASELEDMWDMACEQNNISDLAVLIREKDIEICGESVDGSEYIYGGQRYELQVPGIYQIYNSATAAATAHVLMRLGYELTEDDIRRGLKATFWKGKIPEAYGQTSHVCGRRAQSGRLEST